MMLAPSSWRAQVTVCSTPEGRGSLIWLGVPVLGNGVLCGLLLVAAVLKETNEFWLNAGGYPLLLREAVLWLFYPFGLVCLVGVASGTLASVKLVARRAPLGWLLFVLCSFQTLLLLAVLVVVLWNNAANLWHGLPTHQH
jgi:hypothetical protein